MESYSNDEILKGIRGSDDRVIRYVYRTCFPDVRKLVLDNSGSEHDAEDLIQEALMVSYNKLSAGDMTLNCQFGTYLYSVSRFLWLKELKRRRIKKTEYCDPEDHAGRIGSAVDRLETAKMKMYRKHFGELSEECRKVLYMYFEKVSMEEICREMGYKNIQIAKDKKYRCKKSLITRIANNPEYKKVNDEIHMAG